MSITVPIIDSHIHLYPSSELTTLTWNTPGHPLWKQTSIAEYRQATASSHDILKGFIFLETDRKNDESDPTPDGGWKHPLQEVSWLARIASGKPRDGEGHEEKDKDLCLGIIPWAPVPAGPEVLERYIEAVKEAATRDGDESVWKRVKGFRYLLQDKPDGRMLEDNFIEGLKLLGRKGLVFDVGVDQHRRGRLQLEQAVEMIERAHEGVKSEEKVTFILSEFVCTLDSKRLCRVTNSGADVYMCGQTTSVNPTSLSSTQSTQALLPGERPFIPSPKLRMSTCTRFLARPPLSIILISLLTNTNKPKETLWLLL